MNMRLGAGARAPLYLPMSVTTSQNACISLHRSTSATATPYSKTPTKTMSVKCSNHSKENNIAKNNIIPQEISKINENITNPQEISKNNMLPTNNSNNNLLVVVSFYKFADFPDHAEMRAPLKELCEELHVSGGVILAPEGVNGSICGTRESVEKVLAYIQADPRLKGMRMTESPAGLEEEAIHHGHSNKSPLAAGDDAPFRWAHVRVKLKKEVVPLGVPGVSPASQVGKYVSPKEWNSLISESDTMVVDVRNSYEIRIGKFHGAVDPQTSAFRDFPFWVEDNLINSSNGASGGELSSCLQTNPSKIAMYCTGGIRCEKATSFLLSKGFKEVYHLKGGILKYLEEVSPSESLWEGECFVFDKRVSVGHGLKQGNYKLCYACKKPVSDEDIQSPEWEDGVSCPYCFSEKTEEEKERARARQRQYELWGLVGGPHRGVRPKQTEKELKHSQSNLSKSI